MTWSATSSPVNTPSSDEVDVEILSDVVGGVDLLDGHLSVFEEGANSPDGGALGGATGTGALANPRWLKFGIPVIHAIKSGDDR